MSEFRDDDVGAKHDETLFLPRSDSERVTAFSHYYRGELSRMIAWRDRLDLTTNWAIAASAAMLSVSLSSPNSHHAVVLCCMGIVFLLLAIESRRYQFYDGIRQRVRLVERNYYARILEPGTEQEPADWRAVLTRELQCPRYRLTLFEAMSIRLRRNYLWIYLILLLSWWLKVTTVVLDAQLGEAKFIHSMDELLQNARVSYIPGWLVVGGVFCFGIWVFAMALFAQREACRAEVREAEV